MSSSTQYKQSFWTTLPGILTAIAAILTAAGGVLAVVLNASKDQRTSSTTSTSPAWVAQANQICQQTTAQNLPVYNPADPPASQFTELNDFVSAQNSLDQSINALAVPANAQASVTQMLQDWQNAANAVAAGARSIESGDSTSPAAALARGNSLNSQGNAVANELGLGNCASGTW